MLILPLVTCPLVELQGDMLIRFDCGEDSVLLWRRQCVAVALFDFNHHFYKFNFLVFSHGDKMMTRVSRTYGDLVKQQQKLM